MSHVTLLVPPQTSFWCHQGALGWGGPPERAQGWQGHQGKAQGWQGHQGGHRTVTSRGRRDSSAFPIPVFPASLLGPPGRSPSSCRFLGLAPGSGKV